MILITCMVRKVKGSKNIRYLLIGLAILAYSILSSFKTKNKISLKNKITNEVTRETNYTIPILPTDRYLIL